MTEHAIVITQHLKGTVMKVSLSFVSALFIIGSFSFSSVASGDPDEPPASVKNWKLLGAGDTAQSDTDYCFQNQTIHQCIRYGHRGRLGGINLVWDKSETLTTVRFVSESGGDVKYGQKLALRVEGIESPFVHYQKRMLGINLDWSKSPVFEWIIVGGAEGQPVKVGDEFAVINTVEKDFLIYAPRGKYVINLRWYADRNKGGYMDRVRQIVKKEAIPYALKYFAP